MFIVWGTKIVRKNLDRRAEFCRLCRDFQPSSVVEVKSVGYLYHMPLGRRQVLGLELTCESCGLLSSGTFENGYPSTVRDRHADVETLITATHPDARRNWSERLAYEDRIRANGLTVEKQASALLGSFLLANTFVERRALQVHLDWVSGLALLATFAIPLALVALFNLLSKTGDEVTTAIIAVAASLGLFTLILCMRYGHRYTRRTILPMIIRAPTGPSCRTRT